MNKVTIANTITDYKVGDLFINNEDGSVFILAEIGINSYMAIELKSGKRWLHATKFTINDAKFTINDAVEGLEFACRYANITITL